MNRYLGIEIGGTKLQLVSGSSSGTIAERRRFQIEPSLGAQNILQQIKSCLKSTNPDVGFTSRSWEGAGVAFGGPLDLASGSIMKSHQVPGWDGYPLRDWLQELIQAPVVVENDAGVAALAEFYCGAGVGVNSIFYVTLGSGVGGGMIHQGKIYHGASPGESEIGHIRLDRKGSILESVCSGWAVDRRLREWWSEVEMHESSERQDPLVRFFKDNPTVRTGEAKWLGPALDAGSDVAARVLDDVADALALGLSHVGHLFHPDRIVIGGGLSLIGEHLRQRVEAGLDRYLMEVFRPRPEVKLALLREDVATTGALLLAGRKG